MEEIESIKELLKCFVDKSYIPCNYFDLDETLLECSVKTFKDDYLRWFPNDEFIDSAKLLITPQLSTLLCYRISRAIKSLSNNKLPTGGGNADAWSLLGRDLGQIEIYYSAQIGNAFKINHGVGSVIGARCKIGDNCTIHQNCTIGDRNGGRPTIGNNVMIYAGAMILGDIVIGDNCIIGANSVVTHDCQPNSVIVGTPGKKIKSL